MKYLLITLIIFISFTQAQYRWEKLNGPPGGFVPGLVVKGDTLIAGTGGQKAMIFYSTNKGVTWEQADIKLQHRFVDFVFTDDGGIIAASYANKKLFKSFNMHNWTSLLSSNTDNFSSLGKDKYGFIYAGTETGKIYSSTDNGLNWLLNYNGSERIHQFHLTDSNTFYAGNYFKLLKQTNGNWISILFTDIDLVSILSDNDGNLYVHDAAQFRKSTDGGFNWQLQSFRPFTSMYYAVYNQRIIGTHGDLSFAGGTTWGIMVSEDEGITWTMSNQGLPPRFSAAVRIVKSGTDTYVSTNAAGVFRSTDFGENWFPVNNGLNAAFTNDFRIAMDGTFYAASWCNGITRSTDKGKNWEVINNGLTNSYLYCIIEDDNGNLIAGTNGALFRSTDKGLNWFQTSNAGNNFGYNLYKDKQNRIYFLSWGSGLYRTTDLGVNWIRLDQGFINNNLLGFAIDSSANLYAGTTGGAIYKSTDDGISWIRVYLSSDPSVIVYNIAVAPNGNIFAAIENEGVVRSTDNGVSWELKNNGITSLRTRIIEVNKKGEVFVSTWSQYFTPNEDKLYRSVDNGETWENITGNMKMVSVRNIRFDEEDNLYLATDESVWRSYPDSTTQTADIPETVYEYSLSQNYPNPFNPTTKISYTLKDERYVKLLIYDIKGELISTLVNEQQQSGNYEVDFKPPDNISTGVYIYKLTVSDNNHNVIFSNVKKMIFLK